MTELKKMRYFLEVARQQSFSKAAKSLYVSQTTISQQIVVLENELGVQLFDRNKKQVRITDAGKVFYREAERLLRQYENAVQKTKEFAKGIEGMLRIGFFSLYDRDVIAPLIKDFHLQYPKVKINIVQCNYRDMLVNLLNRTIDIGFCFQMDSDEIEEYKICETLPKLCVNKNHEFSQMDSLKIEDLQGEKIISYIKNKDQKDYYHLHYKGKEPLLKMDDSFLVESMDDALMLVAMDLGICFLPEPIHMAIPSSIDFIEQSIEKIPFEVKAYWSKEKTSRIVDKFIQLFRN